MLKNRIDFYYKDLRIGTVETCASVMPVIPSPKSGVTFDQIDGYDRVLCIVTEKPPVYHFSNGCGTVIVEVAVEPIKE